MLPAADLGATSIRVLPMDPLSLQVSPVPKCPGRLRLQLHSPRPFSPPRQGHSKSTRSTGVQREHEMARMSKPVGRTTGRSSHHGDACDRPCSLGRVLIWTRTCKGTRGVRPSGMRLASEGAVQHMVAGVPVRTRGPRHGLRKNSGAGPLRAAHFAPMTLLFEKK